ncbi:hypothetical protein SETIT_5G116900v2 [Setaria italica]|uniref:Uncharacterized protein n=1 Tax=Setaria italica TaxID=4555 RepID=A0A368R434_SETIT|nr:hypothetical protein SETIT_5G116900v2 [Setaria italica]
MHRGACGCARGAGEVPREELEAPWLDLEKGRGQDYTVAQTMTAAAPADDMTEATRAALLDAQELEIEKAASTAIKCVFRGYVATRSLEELVFTLYPLGILVVAVSMFLCILVGSIDKCVPTTIPPPYKISQAKYYASSP